MVNVGSLLFSREIAGLRCLQSSLFKTDTFGTNISVCLIESQIEGVKKGSYQPELAVLQRRLSYRGVHQERVNCICCFEGRIG